MKRGTLILFSIVLLVTPVHAADSDLNIRTEALKEWKSTYTSITDQYELDILTAESARRQAQFHALQKQQRDRQVRALFTDWPAEIAPKEAQVQAKSQEMGLFLKAETPQTYHKPRNEDATKDVNPVAAGSAIVLLGLGGFIFSSVRHKRKKRRKAHVYYSDDTVEETGI